MAEVVQMLGEGGLMNENAVLRRTGKDVISNFLRQKTLYEVIRRSGKVGLIREFSSVHSKMISSVFFVSSSIKKRWLFLTSTFRYSLPFMLCLNMVIYMLEQIVHCPTGRVCCFLILLIVV